MEARVVAHDMDHSVTAKLPSQVVQVSDEQRGVAPPRWSRQQQSAGPPMQRAGQVALLVVARRDDFGLLAANHPTRADLGVQVHVNFILEDDRLGGGQLSNQPPDLPQFVRVVWIAGTDDGAWSVPDELHAVHSPAHGLRTEANALAFPQQQGQQLTGPAAAEEAEVLRSEGKEPRITTINQYATEVSRRSDCNTRAKPPLWKSRFTAAIKVGLASAAVPICRYDHSSFNNTSTNARRAARADRYNFKQALRSFTESRILPSMACPLGSWS